MRTDRSVSTLICTLLLSDDALLLFTRTERQPLSGCTVLGHLMMAGTVTHVVIHQLLTDSRGKTAAESQTQQSYDQLCSMS